jgi:hypothetical protein
MAADACGLHQRTQPIAWEIQAGRHGFSLEVPASGVRTVLPVGVRDLRLSDPQTGRMSRKGLYWKDNGYSLQLVVRVTTHNSRLGGRP